MRATLTEPREAVQEAPPFRIKRPLRAVSSAVLMGRPVAAQIAVAPLRGAVTGIAAVEVGAAVGRSITLGIAGIGASARRHPLKIMVAAKHAPRRPPAPLKAPTPGGALRAAAASGGAGGAKEAAQEAPPARAPGVGPVLPPGSPSIRVGTGALGVPLRIMPPPRVGRRGPEGGRPWHTRVTRVAAQRLAHILLPARPPEAKARPLTQ